MRGCGNRRQAVAFNHIGSLKIDAKLIERQEGDITHLANAYPSTMVCWRVVVWVNPRAPNRPLTRTREIFAPTKRIAVDV